MSLTVSVRKLKFTSNQPGSSAKNKKIKLGKMLYLMAITRYDCNGQAPSQV